MDSIAEAVSLIELVHDERPGYLAALVTLSIHPERPYEAFVERRLEYLCRRSESEAVQLALEAVRQGAYGVFKLAMSALSEQRQSDPTAVAASLIASERLATRLPILLDMVAIEYPAVAIEGFRTATARSSNHLRAYNFRTPVLREMQSALVEDAAPDSGPESAVGRAADLLNRIPPPPPCDWCEGCPDCEGCRGCYGCHDCTDCTGCQGCLTCGKVPRENDFRSRLALTILSPCRKRIISALRNGLAVQVRAGVPLTAQDITTAVVQTPCALHPLSDAGIDVEELLRLTKLSVVDGRAQGTGASEQAISNLLHQARPFDEAILPAGISLRDWQREALTSWTRHGRQGVVEAVTGAGKTMLGICAILEATAEGRLVVVVVPKRILQDQWVADLKPIFRHRSGGVRRLGNGRHATPSSGVLVAVVNSLAEIHKDYPDAASLELAPLIVADECHNYGGPSFRRSLTDVYESRLGLTATLDGDDVSGYFSGVVFELDHSRALAERAICPYRMLVLRTPLDLDEVKAYDRAHHTLMYAQNDLLRLAPELQPLVGKFSTLSGAIRRIASEDQHPANRAATRWITAFEDRADVLSTSRGKARGIISTAPAIRCSTGTLIFTMMKEPAKAAAKLVDSLGISVESIDSDSPAEYRTTVVRALTSGTLKAVVAPRILDEGMNVPKVDTAIIVATSKRRRQIVQRLGRIIRVKTDPNHRALLIVLCAMGTDEDPHAGRTSGSLLDEIMGNASEALVCDVDDERAIAQFIRQGSVGRSPNRTV